MEKVLDQDRKLKYLEGKRNQNLETLNRRIEELVREKEKKQKLKKNFQPQ